MYMLTALGNQYTTPTDIFYYGDDVRVKTVSNGANDLIYWT